MAEDIYVVVADNDQHHKMPNTDELFYDDKGPLIFEAYVNKSSMEDMEAFIARLGGKYGKCRVAKLEFIK